jgi:hypothetical protein
MWAWILPGAIAGAVGGAVAGGFVGWLVWMGLMFTFGR